MKELCEACLGGDITHSHSVNSNEITIPPDNNGMSIGTDTILALQEETKQLIFSPNLKLSLEEQFKEAVGQAKKELDIEYKKIQQGFKNMTDISKKYGVPISFELGISYAGVEARYMPKGKLATKWKKIRDEGKEDLWWDALYNGDFDYSLNTNGWEHSSMC